MSLETIAEGITEALNRDAVERQGRDDPDWLVKRRADAWSEYERTPFPTTRSEEWRYTDVKRVLKLDALTLASGDEPSRDPASWPALLQAAMKADRQASGHVVEIDGRVVSVDLDPDLTRRGVVLTSLRDALHEHGEMLERYLASKALPATEGKFQALNAALWSDGVFLFVPKDVELQLPVRVTRWASNPGTAYFTRSLIFADQHSQASLVDELLSDDFDSQTLHSTAVEVFAQDEARVQYVSVQRMGRGAFHLSQQRTLAHRGSKLDTLNVNLGASVARLDLNAQLLGPGATSDMLGLYFGDASQHFDHNTSQDHIAPNTNSDLLYKGALDDKARAVFRGIIRVHEGAQRTDAYQTNRNLLLSDHARADSLPNLEILADDVRCSHGATVGQLDAEMRFYLMSRGMDRERAERLVVMGFLGEVLGKLPLGGVVDKVTRVIEAKLGHV